MWAIFLPSPAPRATLGLPCPWLFFPKPARAGRPCHINANNSQLPVSSRLPVDSDEHVYGRRKMSTGTAAAPERLEFKTELTRLLDLIIHSLYTKKEIFLREL